MWNTIIKLEVSQLNNNKPMLKLALVKISDYVLPCRNYFIV